MVARRRRGGVEGIERAAPRGEEGVRHSREVLVADVAEAGEDAVGLAELGHAVP
jgi:hypothetical protein